VGIAGGGLGEGEADTETDGEADGGALDGVPVPELQAAIANSMMIDRKIAIYFFIY